MKIDLQQRKFRIGVNYVSNFSFEFRIFVLIFKNQMKDPPYSAISANNKVPNGFEDEMFKILAKYFNFTYDLIDFNGEYGFQDDNGNWNGLIGGLINDVRFDSKQVSRQI